MTIVEFFDKAPLENIASGLLCAPEKIILVGYDKKPLEKAKELFTSILKNRGIESEIFYKTTNKNNLTSIVSILSEIVEQNENCTFDLTGGEDLYLVALGIIMERYGNRVSCHRVNFNNDSLIDCDADGKVSATGEFDITVDEIVSIHGGSIVTDPKSLIYTYPWVIDDEFSKDIAALWNICRKKANSWNSYLVSTLKRISEANPKAGLTMEFDKNQILGAMLSHSNKIGEFDAFLSELSRLGLVNLGYSAPKYTLTFKNDQIKRCLTIEGQVLELFVASNIRGYKFNGNKQLYHDVKVGVVIDWDSPNDPDKFRTINEIDVLAVKGMMPIFISCKNGDFDVDEFYKLGTVADQFGAKYAKKVLVCHDIAANVGYTKASHLKARAEDMNIRIIDLTPDLSEQDIERKLRSLWSNS